MKKTIALFTVLSLISITNVFSQEDFVYNKWETLEEVDQHGNGTGKTFERIYCFGMYYNNITRKPDDFTAQLVVASIDKNPVVTLNIHTIHDLDFKKLFNVGGDYTKGRVYVQEDQGGGIFVTCWASPNGGIVFYKTGGEVMAYILEESEGERVLMTVDESQFENAQGSQSYSFYVKCK